MKNKATEEANEVNDLIEDAQALMSATANIAEDKVVAARRRVAAALDKGKEALNDLKERAIAGAKATDETIRENPYQSMGVALGVGLVVGYMLGRRR